MVAALSEVCSLKRRIVCRETLSSLYFLDSSNLFVFGIEVFKLQPKEAICRPLVLRSYNSTKLCFSKNPAD